jgi:phage host-nuclease inhibitor protein Gam
MAKRVKVLAPSLPVPQTREEAAAAVAAIGAAQRELGRIEAGLNDRVAKLKESAEAAATPLRERIEGLTEGLRTWADANRQAITGGGKTKTVDLGTGVISWRLRPPKVSLPRKPEALAEIIEKLKAMALQRFVRTTEEVNREAMRAEPELARTVPGIKIGSAGEDFAVEPFEVALAEGGR